LLKGIVSSKFNILWKNIPVMMYVHCYRQICSNVKCQMRICIAYSRGFDLLIVRAERFQPDVASSVKTSSTVTATAIRHVRH